MKVFSSGKSVIKVLNGKVENVFNNNNNNSCINIARKTLHLGRRRIYQIVHENWWCSF